MKKFLPFLASLLLASVSWGQTGNGVVLLTDASYTFTPTTVDSSSTFNVQLKNTVGIAQTVFFGGLDAPFVLSNNDPIEVASHDTIDFSITFTPSAIGSFSADRRERFTWPLLRLRGWSGLELATRVPSGSTIKANPSRPFQTCSSQVLSWERTMSTPTTPSRLRLAPNRGAL